MRDIVGKRTVKRWLVCSKRTVERQLLSLWISKCLLLNGLEATKIIREEEKELPIIMQTAYAFTADRENAMAAGASEVLVKPITLSALRTCLSKFLPQLQW